MQQFGARCPPIVPAPPQPHQLTLERSLVCPDPDPCIFPSPNRNPAPTLPLEEKLQAWAVALNIHKTNPATFPSSQ